MADRKETVVIDFEIDVEQSIESIESLTAANKELRNERNALNLASEQGRKRAAELNAQIDANTSKIKDNVSAIEKQKINIGNYKSALEGVNPAFGKLADGLEKGASGFKAMTLEALAFIATPIGAIIAALVAVFALLSTALSKNDALMDKLENVTNAVSVVFEVLLNRVALLGEALIALFSGDIDGAIAKTGEAFSGLAEEIGNAVKQQQLFLDASRELEDSQRALRIETAKTENEIKRLVVAAKNRNLSLDEQEKLLNRALELEQDLVRTREDLARRDLVITARRLRADKEFQQQANETFDQYIDRLLSSSKLGGDQMDQIVEKVEALEQARGSSLAFQEKIANQLAANAEKRAEALKKQNEALAEQAALEAANRRAQNIPTQSQSDPFVYAFSTRARLITDINKRMNADLTKMNQKFQDEEKLRQEKGLLVTEQVERQKLALTATFLSTASTLAEEGSVANKFLASASALVNTYLAATAALASGSEISPIYGALAYANAILVGLQAVAKINGVEFAEGGWTGPGQKMKAVGVVHADEYVVPKRLVNSPAAQPHIASLERMRIGYADGGFTTNTSVQGANQSLAIANVLKNMPPMEVSVKEVTKVQNRIKVKEQISKR